MANKRINFAVDKFELIEDAHNSQLAKMKYYVCRDGNNLHNLPISWETISNASHTLVGKPILTNYINYKDDFGSHDSDQKPVGCFISKDDIREEEDSEGNKWLTAIGYVWRKYFPEVFNVIERNEAGEGTRVSMEIELVGDDNDERINNFAFMGLTLLGKNVQPAIPNARGLLNFSAMVEETEQLVFGSGYRGIDFKIPDKVKSNSQKGLSLYKEYKKGGNSYILAMARYLSKNDSIEPSKIKKLSLSLKNKFKQNKDGEDGHISFMLLGGKDCMDWCDKLMLDMKDADENQTSHFVDKNFNTSNGTEMEENTLKKNKEEFAEEVGKEEEKPVEKMAEQEVEEKEPEKQEEKMAEKPVEEDGEKTEEKPFAESQEDEAKEPVEEEVKETPSEEDKEVARLSLDGYADMGATLAMLGMETESNKELASQYVSPEAGKQFSILVSEVRKLYEQNISLKEFKADIEKKQFAHIVESTLAEVSDIMPKAKLDECRVNSEKFSIENITGWQNEVKALAFTFAKDGLKKEDDGIVRYALPFMNIPKKEKSDSLWG